MNFQQLCSIREVARHDFNLTAVADALFVSQPGVGRQIRDFEDELGLAIFIRHGRRLTGLTDAGQGILKIVDRLLTEADQLEKISLSYAGQTSGSLSLVSTRTDASYALPQAVQRFRAQFRGVRIALRQSSPEYIAELLLSGKADIGLTAEDLSLFPDIVTFPWHSYGHLIVVPEGHVLQSRVPLRLHDLAPYPLITCDTGFAERRYIDQAFARAGLTPDIVLATADSHAIKHYVVLGQGIGIMAATALDQAREPGLCGLDASHLFECNTIRLALRRGVCLPSYAYEFIRQLAPDLTRESIERAIDRESAAEVFAWKAQTAEEKG